MSVEFLKKESILSQLKKAFEEKAKTEVECPISLKKYEVEAIKAFELQKLKKVRTIKSLVKNLIELVVSKVNAENLEEVVNENSYLDYYAILKGVLEASYESDRRADFECPECGQKFDLEVKFSQFENTSKKWDKEQPFKDFRVEYDYKIEDKGIELKFVMKIPTIKEFYHIIDKIAEDINLSSGINSPLTLTGNILSDLETLVMVTEKLIVKTPSLEEPVVFTSKTDIEDILENSGAPISIYKEALEKFSNEIKDYVPIYRSQTQCPSCKEKIDIYLEPQVAFINKLFV